MLVAETPNPYNLPDDDSPMTSQLAARIEQARELIARRAPMHEVLSTLLPDRHIRWSLTTEEATALIARIAEED